MKISLIATSSDGSDFYDVQLIEKHGDVMLTCDCHAGEMGTLCRHRIALLTNKTTGIFRTEDNKLDRISSVISKLEESGLSGKYQELAAKLDDLEKNFKSEKKKIKWEMNRLIPE